MDMSVALLIDQRKVDDWPRSMEVGSAVKLLMVARADGCVGGALVGGGGGGGGGGVFLQPDTNNAKTSAKTMVLNCKACDLGLSVM